MPSVNCLCLLLTMCLSVSFSLESFKTEDGYETFPSMPGSRYKLYTLKLTWGEALSLCQGDGGESHLVVINTQEEADVVKNMLTRIIDANATGCFVGINDIVQEGYWVTVLGGLVTASGYNKWQPGQPNGDTIQNCGFVDWDSLYVDSNCEALSPFICEKPDICSCSKI